MNKGTLMKRILIANRGEVALRIIRTARELGLETIAVYSEADRNMDYLNLANERVQIGPAYPAKSYLNMDTIIAAAITWKANAIHPGYGFLSENPIFAAKCEENGIAFIGPSSTVLRTIGNKSRTKEVAFSLGIPTIPGSGGFATTVEQAMFMAKETGYPVILKSLYGGGGRGMKVANDEDQLIQHFDNVSSEANAAFGRSEIYIERYIDCPRHLEVQVASDSHGNIRILGDRECSIQRRHQKIIEEGPIPFIEESTRKDLRCWSKKMMAALEFEGLGTVEFLMDKEGHSYFLEINGRLQVEHPVTEMLTGLDIVREQILISVGSEIPEESPVQTGHAIECTDDDFDYKTVVASLSNFMNTELSAFYFDIRKDALYCDPPSSVTRKAALTTVDILCDAILKWLAPVVSFTSDEAWRNYRPGGSPSVHLLTFPDNLAGFRNERLAAKWETIRGIRRVVTGALEVERAAKRIGLISSRASPVIYLPKEYMADLFDVDWAEVCITSNATVVILQEGEDAPADAFGLDHAIGIAVKSKKPLAPNARGRGRYCRAWAKTPNIPTCRRATQRRCANGRRWG